MKLEELKQKLMVDTISKKDEIITVRKGFFYRMGKSEDNIIERINKSFPNAEIIDSGEIWKPFRGGASVSKQSHWYVKFKLPDLSTLLSQPEDKPQGT